MIAAAAWSAASVAAAQTPAEPLALAYGITGSASSIGYDNGTVLLSRREVQALVLRAAEGGVNRG
jgi:hypothetical protein